MQKYGYRANEVIDRDVPFTCIVCKTEKPEFSWTDLFGEAMCTRCGTPYQLVSYKDGVKTRNTPPTISIKESWIPIMQRYWQETHEFIGLGMFLGFDVYQECKAGQYKFFDWVKRHNLEPKEDSEQ